MVKSNKKNGTHNLNIAFLSSDMCHIDIKELHVKWFEFLYAKAKSV